MISSTTEYAVTGCRELKFEDESPDYNEEGAELLKFFNERLREAADETRYLPDAYSVAFLAMRIGLCRIESTEKTAIDLRNKVWLENGKKEKLKKEIVKELDKERDAYRFEELKELPAKEVLEFYRKINSFHE